MTQPARPRSPVADDTVAAATRLLAEHGARGASQVVALLHERYDARVVLRLIPDAVVVAQAPMLAPVEPGAHSLELPVRHRGRVLAVLSVSRQRALPARAAETLRVVADIVGLALAEYSAPERAAAQAVLDAEADRAQLFADIDELREALVALPHTESANVPKATAAALSAVREIGRELRVTALADGLRHALAELAKAGAYVAADDPALDRLAPAVAVVVERVAEAATRGAVETAHIVATVAGGWVKLSAESADNSVDASELERWSRRAHALGGDLRQRPGAIELTLPAATSDDEGRHDDRPHLRRPPLDP